MDEENKREKSNLELWAEDEVKIACARENPNRKEGEFDYRCACYESALKAFKSLCEDEHSGASIMFTKAILDRLITGKPLTSIEVEVVEIGSDMAVDITLGGCCE